MKVFAKLGELVLRLFDITGAIILGIPKIPDKLRGINSEDLKDKIDTNKIRENVSKIKTDVKTKSKSSKKSKTEDTEIFIVNRKEKMDNPEVNRPEISEDFTSKERTVFKKFELDKEFTSKEKERTVFTLQLASLGFLVFSIIYLFKYISFMVYCILGLLLVGYIAYILSSKVKSMYPADFNAYRDFFLMYVAAGIILVLVGTNPNLVMSFSFQFFPDLTILIFAVILAVAVFLIFRIRYYRDYTYGTVIETGKKTAYVQVDYDIRSNVKPDIYVVDNTYGAEEDEDVKLQIEEKLMSRSGNKPVSIIETLKKK